MSNSPNINDVLEVVAKILLSCWILGFVRLFIPAFLILHVADRPDTTAQSQALAQALKGAGVQAKVVPGEGKTHATIMTSACSMTHRRRRCLSSWTDC